MFFPCTTQETVYLDGRPIKKSFKPGKDDSRSLHNSVNNSSNEDEEDLLQGTRPSTPKKTEYLTKPTVLMCNPNALVYQQMITSPNAYWLHFFLRREINVICWNYRGYGESTQSFFNWLGPNDSK